jgi:RimJ/RimL family protein N-acetyltransferase
MTISPNPGWLIAIKRGSEATVIEIKGVQNAGLRPVSCESPAGADVYHLTLWRNQHVHAFLSEFVATEVRTERWLREHVGPDPTRVVFMVEVEDQIVGYMGLAHIDWNRRSFELDGIVRGRTDAPRGVMTRGVLAMIDWAVNCLGLDHPTVRVLAHNTHAVAFYRRMGFAEARRAALYRVTSDEGSQLTEESTGEAAMAMLIYMTLDRT